MYILLEHREIFKKDGVYSETSVYIYLAKIYSCDKLQGLSNVELGAY